MFKYYILAFAIACAAFTSCKPDKDEAPAPAPAPTPVTLPVVEVPKNTSVLIVSALSDNSSALAFSLDADAISTVGSNSSSAYVAAAEGTRKLKFSVAGAAKELPVTLEKDKYYTLVVYGTSANPSVSVIEDKITTVVPAGQFAYRYLNVCDSSKTKSISAQAYYGAPYNMWATVVGAHENIAFGKSSAFTNYTSGIEAQWRMIKAGSETAKGVMSGTYNTGVDSEANVAYTPKDRAKGTSGKHFTYVIFGYGETATYKLIVHEDQIAK